MGSGSEGYYLGLAHEDYYTEGGEPPGRWIGRGAEELGLSGIVEGAHLSRVLRGVHPHDERIRLTQNPIEGERQPGWDLTFSAPKTVSVLWAIADEPTRQAIQLAQAAAVQAAVAYLEESVITTRRGKGGLRRERAHIVVATFEHGTSRLQDPQLHIHALLANLGIRLDGTTGAITSKEVYRHKLTAGALYRAELAWQLIDRLGVKLCQGRHSFEIDRVPEDLVRKFSKRAQQIRALLGEKGRRSSASAEVAAFETRERKQHFPREVLFEKWRDVAIAFGWTRFDAESLTHQRVVESPVALLSQSIAESIEALQRMGSFFSEQEVIRAVAIAVAPHGVKSTQILESVQTVLEESHDIVGLGLWGGERVYATQAMIQAEERLVQLAELSKATRSHRVKPLHHGIQAALRGDEVASALQWITSDEGTIKVVRGLPGTGKTTMLVEACRAWESAGFKVIGAAPTGVAAARLQQASGIQSATLAWMVEEIDHWFSRHAKHVLRQFGRAARKMPTYTRDSLSVDEKTVLVIDEAAMASTWELCTVIEHATRKGAKTVVVGDDRQTPPVGPGGGFSALRSILGGPDLKDIKRQQDQWARDAVRLAAEGDISGALAEYAKRGVYNVYKTRAQTIDALISSWTTKNTRKPAEGLILVGTNEEAYRINQLIQDRLKRLRRLPPLGLSNGRETFYRGDRIIFTENNKRFGVQNGRLGTVTSVNPLANTISVELDGKDLRTGKKTTVTLPARKFSIFRLAYAVTTYKAQGASVPHSYVFLGDGPKSREEALVQLSRSEIETQVFASVEEPVVTKERLERQMSQPKARPFAIEVKRENQPLEPPPLTSSPDTARPNLPTQTPAPKPKPELGQEMGGP